MSDDKSLTKITNKYHCMVTGEKRMSPCSGCQNPQGCLSRAMQYKENETMDELSEKAVVKIDADGGVIKCAKGLASGDCGFKAGSKVCGVCGAMPVEGKAAEEMVDEEEMVDGEEMPKKPKKPNYVGMEDDEEEEMGEDMGGKAMKPMMAEDDEEEMVDGEEMADDEEEEMVKSKKKAMAMKPMMDDEEEEMGMDDEEEDEDDIEEMMSMRKRMRNRRMASMGMKSADFDDNAFVCAFERKVYPGASGVCENCPGGCAAEGKLPGLLEVEGMAEDMFSGKVLDSGYSDEADLYVIDIERKDGKTIEAFFEGSSAECLGWHLLDQDIMSQKSAEANSGSIIDFKDAADIATKTIEGHVIGVDPDIFEGFDSYAVEIEGLNGKSYDVYVSLDGEVLGYDEYSAEEAEEIEAEAAEIALKRAYNEESRMEMAKRGHALPDGSYPIKDEADLRNAIQAYGRAKDKDATKAHIIKRAMSLGKEDLIPENWVPKKVKEKYADGEKDASDDFLASLMEFELLTAEEEARDILGNN